MSDLLALRPTDTLPLTLASAAWLRRVVSGLMLATVALLVFCVDTALLERARLEGEGYQPSATIRLLVWPVAVILEFVGVWMMTTREPSADEPSDARRLRRAVRRMLIIQALASLVAISIRAYYAFNDVPVRSLLLAHFVAHAIAMSWVAQVYLLCRWLAHLTTRLPSPGTLPAQGRALGWAVIAALVSAYEIWFLRWLLSAYTDGHAVAPWALALAGLVNLAAFAWLVTYLTLVARALATTAQQSTPTP